MGGEPKERGGIEVRIGLLGEFLLYREGVCIHVVNLDQDVGEAIRGILVGVTFKVMGESYLAKLQDGLWVCQVGEAPGPFRTFTGATLSILESKVRLS